MKTEIDIVQRTEELRALRKELSQETIVGVDTEFHSENRYCPQLMLLQIATPSRKAWLIDPLKVQVEPLGAAMRRLTLVTHGGWEDIRLLYQHLGLRPHRLFETQIAAGMLGLRYPIRLDQLLEKVLGTEITKQETLTDWSKRPLTEKQTQYAAEDALQLLPLFKELCSKLEEKGKLDWTWAASQEMTDKALGPRGSGMEWINWGVAETLDIDTQRVLTRLLEWREIAAQEKNKPSNYILPRSIALDLARRKPKSIKQLGANRKINKGLVNRNGQALLDCISKGLSDRDTFPVPNKEQRRVAKLLRAWAQVVAQDLDIHAELLMPRSLSKDIAFEGLDSCKGWRREAMGEELENFLSGRTGIAIRDGKPALCQMAR
jgi:ribonuclease D